MDLVTVWFVIIAVLWIGFFFLEGFDFGVGALSMLTGRDDVERRQMLATIGPVWDADEVWLVTGGIAIFAAFPLWYAAVFPAAYLPLLLVVACLIIRGVAVEYRSKKPEHRWRQGWDVAVGVSSMLLPTLFGVFWAGMLHGIPIDSVGRFTGESLWSFINGYSLLGGVTLLLFSLAHGASFLALKTSGDLADRHGRLAAKLALATTAAMLAFSAWTYLVYAEGDAGALAVGVASVVAIAAAAVAHTRGRHLLAFWLDGVAVAGFVGQIFLGLYPNALPSTTDGGFTLTLADAAASANSLQLITVVAVLGLPMVIVYQAWSFWVFRARLRREDFEPAV
jgi:cytochrome d ubiquinol oxidase subunit II